MLKQRIVTAGVLLVVFALLLRFASIDFFALALSLIVAAAAWEWSRLSGIAVEFWQSVYAIAVSIFVLICLYLPLFGDGFRWLMLTGLLFWGTSLVQFYLTPRLVAINTPAVVLLLIGLPLLTIAALSIQYLRSYAPAASSGLLLYALGVVWVMDIGAYFSGRRFGKRKLAPSISPGKSWEGVYGGLVAAACLLIVVILFVDWPWMRLALATVGAAAASVIGDLYESRVKRAAGRKDSSQMLPGHGGVLDRLDGVLAAIPVFAFFWSWM